MQSPQSENWYKNWKFLLLVFSSLSLILTSFLKDETLFAVNVNAASKNNLWAHYGQKSLKSKLYELEKNSFVLNLQSTNDAGKQALSQTLIDNLDSEIGRYREEQSNLQKDAIVADTKYETSKRRFKIFLYSFYLSSVALLIAVLALLKGKLGK
jgi:hypothetical protein